MAQPLVVFVVAAVVLVPLNVAAWTWVDRQRDVWIADGRVEKRLDKITVLSISSLIARAIREVFDDGSVTTLFGGLS